MWEKVSRNMLEYNYTLCFLLDKVCWNLPLYKQNHIGSPSKVAAIELKLL